MRIAIPSGDGVTIAKHTGRALGFVIFDRFDEKVELVDYRKNPAARTYTEACQLEFDSCDAFCQSEHEEIWNLVSDCDVLIVACAGPQFVKAMVSKGIETVFCREDRCDEAAQEYALRTLSQFDDTCCKHWYDEPVADSQTTSMASP